MTRLRIEADGGSRGNPGPAGYGALVRDADSGQLLAEVAEAIGRATNNVAEYRGLIAGLIAAAEIDPAAEVEVRMDSKLVVEQMSGRWQIKHAGMRGLALRAAELARGFTSVRYVHIPRERNRHADRLANEAMDAAARGRQWRTGSAAPVAPVAPAGSGWLAGRRVVTELLLVRHGATSFTADARFCGATDVDLDGTGRAQAALLAARLADDPGITAVLSSPLRRAVSTAEIVAERLGCPVLTEADLAETRFGAWEGATIDEVADRWPAELAAWRGSAQVAPPDGESFAATERRISRLRRPLAARYPGGRVLVVSHVTPIKLVVRWAVGAPPEALFRLQLDPASLSRVDLLDDGTGLLRTFNDVAHLREC